MTTPLDFDPYQLLGVDAHADAVTIDRAYKARVRQVHPDVAGPGGLQETKRLNVAREWLLDPELRAQLPPPGPEPAADEWWTRPGRPPEQPEHATREPHASWGWPTDAPRRGASRGTYDPLEDDPLRFDYGARADDVHAFFATIRSLSADERARVEHSLGGEEPASWSGIERRVDLTSTNRSHALGDAVYRVWNEVEEEPPYFVPPRGILFGEGVAVANAYAQWLLLGDVLLRGAPGSRELEELRIRSTWAWQASLGHARYGTYEREVLAFLADAGQLTAVEGERLARSWQKHMGSFLYGRPGDDWFPGATDRPKPDLVSARVAAVDASRIVPPTGLHHDHHAGFRYGLRLTAHVLALGGVDDPRRDYLRPWRDAKDDAPSFADRARWGMPIG